MKKTEKGFTIIEVALVLAIGALIFLVVFLAVPALQRNQRNDARKRDVSNVVEAISDYNANNPTSGLTAGSTPYSIDSSGQIKKDKVLGKYMDTLSTNIKTVVIRAAATGTPQSNNAAAEMIRIYIGSRCDGLDKIKAGSGRQAAVVGTVENNAGYSNYCQDAS